MNEQNDFPHEMKKIIKDFLTDILVTFPEYKDKFTDNELEYLKKDGDTEKMKIVLNYYKTVFPERFFDILYENEDMFSDSEKNTHFLKNIDFKDIWKENISDKTKTIIWKYLQLIMFSLSSNIKGSETFGDTAKMFEAIDEKELKKKLEEVISSMGDVFDMSNNKPDFEEMMKNMSNKPDFEDMMKNMGISGGDMFEEMMKNMGGKGGDMFEEMRKNMDISGGDMFEDMMKNMGISGGDMFEDMMKNMQGDASNNKNIPNPDDIHEHLKSLMGGKLGKLAQEIADETAAELDIDTENITGVSDIFSKLFKNPGQLMGMIKKVSSKLDQKLKSGEINEAELMKEANELVEKMKNTPGMKDMEKMLGKMGMGGKGGKVNMNMFQSMMQSNIKKSSQKERMVNKLNQRKQEKEIMKNIKKCKPSEKEMLDYDEYIQKTFNIDESKMKKSKMKKKKKKKKKKK